MTIAPAIKPQETKPAPLPAYPVAPPSQTQTSSRGMPRPQHYAGGTAYAGVPKGIPHYGEGTDSVLPQAPSGSTGFSGPPHPVAPPPAPFATPVPAAYGPNGRVLYAPITASTLMNNAPSALAHGVLGAPGLTPRPQHPASAVGTPILNANPGTVGAPTDAPFTGTVVRGAQVDPAAHFGETATLAKDPSAFDVGQVGAPYPSTPEQIATAAQHTGANPIALQNAAGAIRDAQGAQGQTQNVAAQQYALANPTHVSPQDFMALFRGQSYRHMGMIADAARAARAVTPYDPKMQIFNDSMARQAQAMSGMKAPKDRAQAMTNILLQEQTMGGFNPAMKMPEQQPLIDPATGQTIDPNTGLPVD